MHAAISDSCGAVLQSWLSADWRDKTGKDCKTLHHLLICMPGVESQLSFADRGAGSKLESSTVDCLGRSTLEYFLSL